jgi:hypothetical protein
METVSCRIKLGSSQFGAKNLKPSISIKNWCFFGVFIQLLPLGEFYDQQIFGG